MVCACSELVRRGALVGLFGLPDAELLGEDRDRACTKADLQQEIRAVAAASLPTFTQGLDPMSHAVHGIGPGKVCLKPSGTVSRISAADRVSPLAPTTVTVHRITRFAGI